MPKAVNRGPSMGCRKHTAGERGMLPIWPALFAILFLLGCAGTPEPEPEPEPEVVEEEPPVYVEDPAPVEPAQRAPREYIVQRGDTLWDISTMFLRDPWLWPEIWHINPQINNPHLIYPGDVITLFYVDGRPHLRIERDDEIYQTTLPRDRADMRLSPRIRHEALPDALPYLPSDAMRALLGRPLVISEDDYADAPYILRSADGRLLTSAGDRIYVRNFNDSDARRYSILRLGNEYRDPDTRRRLGREAIFVGEAEYERGQEPATLFITRAVQEAREGDRLFPVDERRMARDFYPRAPEDEVEGTIIDMVGEGELIGQYQTVVINRGARHGLEHGHVLDVYERGERVRDREAGAFSRQVQLPDERTGLILIYGVEEHVSYGLVMEARREMEAGNRVTNPRARIHTPQTRERRP